MVLAAGLGTRLRPLTEAWPKPAIPLLGQPLFRYNLALLRGAGVTHLGINTHHLPDVMRACAEAECARAGVQLEVVHEPVIQGTGGGIRGLRHFLSGDHFLVLNGDILFSLPLGPVVEAHRASGAAATMVLLPMPAGETFAAVEVDPGGLVRRIAGHGPGGERLAPWHFTGVHVMSPAVFDFMRGDGPEDINREVYVRMLEAGLPIRGHVATGYWSDLGTPSRYLAAQRDLLFGQVPLLPFGDADPFAALERVQAGWISPGAATAGAGMAGPVHVSSGAVVRPGAKLGSAVHVAPGAEVGEGTRLNRVAVFPGTRVAPGEELVECLAWRDVRVPAPLG
jgi:mannose-1-phosphate guanylyltransferase